MNNQLNHKIMYAISEGILNGIDEYNELDEDWKSKAKGVALGLGMGAMTMGGMQSCKDYNAPESPLYSYYENNDDWYHDANYDRRPDYAKYAESQDFLKIVKSKYSNFDSLPDGTLFVSGKWFSDDPRQANCSGRGWVYCGNKRGNELKYDVLRFHREETMDDLEIGQIITRSKLEEMDKSHGWITLSNDDTRDSTGHCIYSGDYQFFKSHIDELDDGQIWIRDKWIALDHTYHFQALKIISVKKIQYEAISNITVNKTIYDKYEKGDLYKE